jgi:hypothetical protein
MKRNVDPVAIGAEIESLTQKISAGRDAHLAAQAQELVRLLMALYGKGLSTMLEIVRTERGGVDAILERFATEPLVGSLLVLHDLHPHPLEVRVERALIQLTPHLPAHTHVTLVAADVDAVRVAVRRTSPSPGGSGETIRLALERAIREAAPETGAVHVEGLEDTLIQVIRTRPGVDTPQKAPL